MRSTFMALATALTAFTATATPPADKKYLVSAEQKLSNTADRLKKDYSVVKDYIKNGFTAYRITYNTTTFDGKSIVASGAVFVPDTKAVMPLLNYNHGTIFPSQERSAPSYLSSGNAELSIAKLFAANGYLVALPDYIGYGAANEAQHPYGAYNIIAASSVDMLHAVQEFCKEKNIRLSGKNFFSGWSEGAAVALAVVKQLEAGTDTSLRPAATVLNAGPYYSSAFVTHILDADTSLRYMKTYAWVLRSYNWLYGINKPYAYYFKQPYADRMEKNSETDITLNPRELFTESFKASYKAGKDTALANALRANDLWQWKPEAPVIFCHGDKDDYVPLFNSEKAYSEMKAKGAPVELKIFKGQNHTGGVFSFLETAFTEFEKRK